jgi:hypothetical protein
VLALSLYSRSALAASIPRSLVNSFPYVSIAAVSLSLATITGLTLRDVFAISLVCLAPSRSSSVGAVSY